MQSERQVVNAEGLAADSARRCSCCSWTRGVAIGIPHMSKFVLGFALCSSLVSCATYKVYEAQCEQEAAEQARRKKRRRKKRLEKRNARAGGRALAASPTKRADASALAASVQKPERHHVGSGGLARGTSAAARRTAQLVTDEVRLALGTSVGSRSQHLHSALAA